MINKDVKNKKLSVCVIIPTYNRVNILEENLRALEGQTIKPDRVIIIDDGSSCKDIERMILFIGGLKLSVTFLKNTPQKGPAAARNKGILISREDVVLFMNDDTVPCNKTFLENHLILAKKFPESSIMGPFGGRSGLGNDFLHSRWIDKLGIEASYGSNAGEILSFQYFCTANVCVPRKFLTDCLFDENFPYAAHEDTDFGYRLHLKGVSLRYNPNSLVSHIHNYTPEMIISRQEKIGKSLNYLLKCHPELAEIFKPKLPKLLCKTIQLLLKTPLNFLVAKDLLLFLRGLIAKYDSFYNGI